MPYAPKTPCAAPRCPGVADEGKRCPEHTLQHKQHVNREDIKRRGCATKRGYGSRWRKARFKYLLTHNFCVRCEAKGIVKLATVVDHDEPHRGDMALFWNRGNWQALCVYCHNAKTAAEDGGFGNKRKFD